MSKTHYLFDKLVYKKFLSKIRKRRKIALSLDFDGTLVPIQRDPAQCYLPDKIKEQLTLLAVSGRCHLMVLSGRSLADIKERVRMRKIYYGGNHGLDISGPGIRYTHRRARAARPVLIKIKKLLAEKIKNIKGAWLEDKKFTLSLHFRSVKTVDIPLVKKIFYNTADELLKKNSLAVIKGKKVLELAPDISWDKGKAALWILHKLKGKYLPVYIGDDWTDETAFRALNKKGITIRVGKSARTAADYYLKSQREIIKFLKHVNECYHKTYGI